MVAYDTIKVNVWRDTVDCIQIAARADPDEFRLANEGATAEDALLTMRDALGPYLLQMFFVLDELPKLSYQVRTI